MTTATKPTAEELVDQLGRFANGMQSEQADAFATALANEHPTLAGQIAKVVALGIMRRAMYDPSWKPYDRTTTGDKARRVCAVHLPGRLLELGGQGDALRLPEHPEHDGRFSCELVVGSELASRQFFV